VVSRVSPYSVTFPHSNTRHGGSDAGFGKRCPQTEWKAADKRRNSSLRDFSGGPKRFPFYGWCVLLAWTTTEEGRLEGKAAGTSSGGYWSGPLCRILGTNFVEDPFR
jgi:hypothetical protein